VRYTVSVTMDGFQMTDSSVVVTAVRKKRACSSRDNSVYREYRIRVLFGK